MQACPLSFSYAEKAWGEPQQCHWETSQHGLEPLDCLVQACWSPGAISDALMTDWFVLSQRDKSWHFKGSSHQLKGLYYFHKVIIGMRAKSLRISANISTGTRDEKVAELLHLAAHIEPIGVVTGIEVTLSGGDPKRNSKYVTCGWSFSAGPAVAALCL